MSSPEDLSSKGAPSNHGNGKPPTRRQGQGKGLLGLFGWGHLAKGVVLSAATGPVTPDGGVDIVDQAEAFKTLRVDDVMTPRADIVAIDISAPFEEVLSTFIEAGHSRMPIYRDNLDDPVGIVHVKDVFKLLADEAKRPAQSEPILHRLRREVLYVPASMRAADLLVKMQATRIHMALVIDEFGGTDGIVTLEDLVEAVVGEIDDEHDDAHQASIVARVGGIYECDARAPLEELEAMAGAVLMLADYEEEIDTVGGLVSALAGRVPQRGEVIAHPSGFEFEITDSDPRRVKRLRMRGATPVGSDAS
jgi:CBS domain containing-hemolysin-like protein